MQGWGRGESGREWRGKGCWEEGEIMKGRGEVWGERKAMEG